MNPHAESENEAPEEISPPGRSLVAAMAAVAATYGYFLVFAQFGFLHALTAALGEGHAGLRPVLAVMGAAGIAGSVLMARWFTAWTGRRLTAAGFVVAGTAAGLTWAARSPELFLAAAVLTGWGTGMITVGLAARLRGETGGRRLGWCIGTGTGLAYAFCNLPPVFTAGASTQAMLGLAAAGAGWFAVRGFRQTAPATQPAGPGGDDRPGGIAGWVLALFVLVAFDSAVFYHIQHTAGLKAVSWTGDTQLGLNAAAHLVAGGLAGWVLDRGRVGAVLLTGAGLLAAGGAAILLAGSRGGSPLYAAGVSVYSTVLVFYPARRGRPGLAALVYAVAGWTGTAIGIGLAVGF